MYVYCKVICYPIHLLYFNVAFHHGVKHVFVCVEKWFKRRHHYTWKQASTQSQTVCLSGLNNHVIL
jgi:hypothetical protein